MLSDKNTQHKGILKSLFFFASLQIIQTIISLVKVKYASVLIGPKGLGDLTLYTTFSNTVVYLVGFGLFNSAVRNISIANVVGDRSEIQRIFNVVTKILVITTIIASSSMIIFRRQINSLFFDKAINNESAFVYLVFFIFFSVFANRNNMLIQGMGAYKKLGRSALVSSLISLFAIFPLFYFWGQDAVVASLIFSSFILYIVSSIFKRSLNIKAGFDFRFKGLYIESSQLIKLGIVMMLSSLLGNVVTNIINIYIVRIGSSYDLGLYNAAITISLQYVGLVFVSLSSEFYPRLASVSHDYVQIREMVNNQIEVILVVLFPLLILMQVFATFMVKIFFTSEFSPIIPFIQVSTIAIIFQALAYVLSNIPMAMGHKKYLFLYNSFLPGVVSLIFSLLGYKVFGLMGLVYALYVVNFFHFLPMYFVVKKSYNFSLHKNIMQLLFTVLLVLLLSLIIVLNTKGSVYYFLISFIFIFVSYTTYKKSVQIFGFNLSIFIAKFRAITKIY